MISEVKASSSAAVGEARPYGLKPKGASGSVLSVLG